MSCGYTCHLWSTGARQEVGLALVALYFVLQKKGAVKSEVKERAEVTQKVKKGEVTSGKTKGTSSPRE